MKIVIIEDEQRTAKDLAKTIQSVSEDVEIIEIIESVEDGKLYFETKKNIDLIFSDIQLGDGLSFEIFQGKPLQIPIIFCTAYNEYALQAFQTFGIDYILKPFSRDTIKAAIEKYKMLASKNDSMVSTDYATLFNELSQKLLHKEENNYLLIFRGDRIIPTEANKIALFSIENSIVYAIRFDEKKESTTYKLDDLEQKLYPKFFRANRQFLVNRKAVKEASQHFHRKLQIHLTISFSETILVGKEKVSSFLNWLTN